MTVEKLIKTELDYSVRLWAVQQMFNKEFVSQW